MPPVQAPGFHTNVQGGFRQFNQPVERRIPRELWHPRLLRSQPHVKQRNFGGPPWNQLTCKKASFRCREFFGGGEPQLVVEERNCLKIVEKPLQETQHNDWTFGHWPNSQMGSTKHLVRVNVALNMASTSSVAFQNGKLALCSAHC